MFEETSMGKVRDIETQEMEKLSILDTGFFGLFVMKGPLLWCVDDALVN